MAGISTMRPTYLSILWLLSAIGVRAQDCGGISVSFGYAGTNSYNCDPFIDEGLQPYLAWYNGSTTMTLTGNAAECPDVTFGPMENALGIGGMTVEGDSTLDRTSYDNNPFYFYMPRATDDVDLTVLFQSSSDYYYTETQSWALQATKSGDGYDITGQWIGEYPTDNYYYHSTTDCWQGGDFWPNAYDDDGDTVSWDITGRLTPESATWTIDQTWLTKSDGIEWHLTISFVGSADPNAPRLVTSGPAPTTDAVATSAGEDATSSSDSASPSSSETTSDSPSETSSDSSSETGSTSGSETSSTSSSETSSTSSSSSENSGSKAVMNIGVMTGLIAIVAVVAAFL